MEIDRLPRPPLALQPFTYGMWVIEKCKGNDAIPNAMLRTINEQKKRVKKFRGRRGEGGAVSIKITRFCLRQKSGSCLLGISQIP